MTILSCALTSLLIPRAAVLMQVLEHIKMTTLGSISTSLLIPGAAILFGKHDHIQMTTSGCPHACACIPRAALAPEPLQYLQVTIPSCIHACACTPRAALASEPLHCLHMTAFAGKGKDIPIQLALEPLFGSQPLQGLQLASARCEEERNESEVKATKRRRDCEEEDSPAAMTSPFSFFLPARSSCSRGKWP